MAEFKFGVTGQDRRALVTAISEILETKAVYMKTPTYAYCIGEITVDKNGMATGEFPFGLLTALAERGFVPEAEAEPEMEATEETVGPEPKTAMEENAGPAMEDNGGPEMEENAGPEFKATTEPEAEPQGASTAETADDLATIEYPLAGFNPERIDNLIKLVESKAILIKQVLGISELPIRMLPDRLAFPWFSNIEGENVNAYAQFIAALCETAKGKRRVTAKPLEESDNPRFTMRVWITGLGLIGREFDLCRKLMIKGLPGNSGHRYGKSNGDTPSRKRDGIQREVISIRLTPETLEKLSILAAKAESESGQRVSRNMLIEQAVEAFVTAEYETAAPEVSEDTLPEAEIAQSETPADESPADAQPEAEGANVADTTADESEVAGDE